MKVVIIGAKGILGQELAIAFKIYKPILWDREDIDISDEQQVQLKINEEKPDIVINAAAYNDVDGAENNEDLANKINGLAVGYLAKSVRALEGILVHYSTDYVFKGDKREGYTESDSPDPQSAYARSKLLGEQQVQQGTDKYFILRLSRLFGKPAISETAKKSFIDVMLELSNTKSELNVVDEELSSPTYAPDLALRTKKIIESKKEFGIYHAANSGACTWYEFAKEIFSQKGIKIKINPVSASFYPRPAKRPRYSILLNTKLPRQRSWHDALKEYLNLKK